jgi:uncharacterized protein Yka (UPF0111/DUF47 family)
MSEEFVYKMSDKIVSYQATRDAYKKQFWLRSKDISPAERKSIKKLFMKIDRLRNHLKLWLKHLVSKKPSNYNSYIQLIERGSFEITQSLYQLDKALHKA